MQTSELPEVDRRQSSRISWQLNVESKRRWEGDLVSNLFENYQELSNWVFIDYWVSYFITGINCLLAR